MVKKRILIAEDDESMCNLYNTLIEYYLEDYICEVVNDGQVALSKIQDGEVYDLIITDMNMPSLTGLRLYESVQEVCREAGRAEPEFIFVSGVQTALDNMGDICVEKRYGCLLKPFTADELKYLVDVAVARKTKGKDDGICG